MSITAEFQLSEGAVPLIHTLPASCEIRITFERVVPVTGDPLPYAWVEGDRVAFEEAMRNGEDVESISPETHTGDRTLYRLRWGSEIRSMIDAFAKSRFTLLAATGTNSGIRTRVRFPTHDGISQYVKLCEDHGVSAELQRIVRGPDGSPRAQKFDLTPKQREALELAAKRGLYRNPRQETLSELARDLGISQQALSQRIRGGTHKLITNGLLQESGE